MKRNNKTKRTSIYRIQYQKKNFNYSQNHIETIRERKRLLQEEKLINQQRQAKLRENLKQKVLTEAAKKREEKRQQLEKAYISEQNVQLYTQQVQKSQSVNKKSESTSKISTKIRQAREHAIQVDQQNERDESINPDQTSQQGSTQGNNNKAQITNYFRSRYASFLNSLAESKKEKQKAEEQYKEKKERQIAKIRNDMGLNQVQSKVLDIPPPQLNKTEIVNPTGKPPRKKEATKEAEEDYQDSIFFQYNVQEEEDMNRIQKQLDINKKIVDKQKMYLEELKNKRIEEKLQKDREALRKEKIKNDIKNQVLNQLSEASHIQTQEEIIESYKKDKVLKENLKGLDIQSSVDKKLKLKPVREKDNEDNDKEDSDSDELPSPNKPKKLRSYPFITDLKIWKKKQRLDDSIRVFIIMGGYPDFKKALLQRGWVENPDNKSPCYELKFTLMGKDVDYSGLQDFQIVNHFERNTALTTKVGICKNLRNLIWFNNVDIDTFYPRCFDCNDETEFEDFLEDFKTTKAEAILKLYMHLFKQKDTQGLEELKSKVNVALKVCQRKIKDINELIDNPQNVKLISKKEWEILSKDDLQAEAYAKKKHDAWLNQIENGETKQKKNKLKKKKKSDDKKQLTQEDEELEEGVDELTNSVRSVLKMFKKKYPQYHLNGFENIWIIKPASLSRGRGIKCYKNLVEILDHVGSKESQWVIQKYIERPLIVKNRKMDIRQWVVVTDFNPVTVWFYDECYIRFSCEEYDVENLDNELQHLTNNSIQKKYLRKDDEILGNMWFESQFSEWLKQQNDGQDVFNEIIKPQMKQTIIWSLEAVQDQIETRKNSFEMFGYDFMIDDRLTAWLIEVNSSPAMDYSTHITEKLVKDVSNDLAKIIVDYGMANKSTRANIDTGKFIKLYRSKCVVEKPNTLGLNLVIEGKQIKM